MGSPSRPIEYQHLTEAPVRPGLLASTGRWRSFAETLLDLIFPPRCAACGQVDTVWCARCNAAVVGAPLLDSVPQLDPLAGIAATALHNGVLQAAVHAIKYERTPEAVPALADRLARQYAATGWQVDIIAPVPLHDSRQACRGYNQAGLLAGALAQRLERPYIPNALARERDTRSQVGLNFEQRQANVDGAFSGDPEQLRDRALLLVDDVYTTGATLRACARAALEAGACHVYGLTVTVAD